MDPTPVRRDPTPALTACACGPWPLPGVYTFAGQPEAVVVIAVEPDGELRIIDERGHVRRVLEERVRLVALPGEMAIAQAAAARPAAARSAA